jgi:hypothetical protein
MNERMTLHLIQHIPFHTFVLDLNTSQAIDAASWSAFSKVVLRWTEDVSLAMLEKATAA